MEEIKTSSESFTWTRPKVIADDIRSKLLRECKVVVPRLAAFALIIEMALYLILKSKVPNEIFIAPSILIALLALQYLSNAYMLKLNRGTYVINPKKIRLSSAGILTWKNIEGYWTVESTQFAGLTSIVLYTKKQSRFTIWLPEDESQHAAIIEFIDSRVPLIEPVDPLPMFSRKQQLFCWSITVSFAVICGLTFLMFPSKWLGLAFFFVLLFCPGTIAMAVVLGRKFYKDRRFAYGFLLNYIALLISAMIVVLFEIYKYHKIIEGS